LSLHWQEIIKLCRIEFILVNEEGDNLQKLLFFDKKQKEDLTGYLENQIEIKNRLLGLIINNLDKKTSGINSRKKALKYEQQIILLQNMLNHCSSINSREDLKRFNSLIDQYNLFTNSN
jgi:hypothetical protein